MAARAQLRIVVNDDHAALVNAGFVVSNKKQQYLYEPEKENVSTLNAKELR